MRELRAIHKDSPLGIKRIRLTTRDETGEDYETIGYTGALPLNKGRILVFLGNYYNLEPGHIKWPAFIKMTE